MAAGSITVRELLVRLGVVTTPKDDKSIKAFDAKIESTKKHLGEASDAAKSMGTRIGELAKWAAAGAVAVGGLVAALGYQAVATAQTSREIERQSQALGLTTDAYQEYSAAFGAFGVEATDMADLFAQISQQAKAAAAGSGTIADTFTSIGISAKDLKDASPDRLLDLIADGLARATSDTERLAAASSLLGEDLTKKLGPVLLKGSAGIAQLRRNARDAGLVMSGPTLAASAKLADQIGFLGQQLTGLRNTVGAALVPALSELVDGLSAWLTANNKVIRQQLERVVRGIGVAVHFLGEVIRRVDAVMRSTFGGWATVLTAIAAGVGTVAAAFLAFKVGGVVFDGLVAVNALLSAMGVILGVDLIPLWIGLGIVLAASAIALAATAPLWGSILAVVTAATAAIATAGLVIDDLATFIRGGKSELGEFVNAWAATPGVLGAVARIVRDLRGLLWALGEVLAPVGRKVEDTLVAGLQRAADVVWTLLRPVRMLLGYLGALMGISLDSLASGLDAVDTGIQSGTRRLAGPSGGSPFADRRDPGSSFAPRGTPGSGSSTTNSTISAPVTNTFHITGGDPHEIAAQVANRLSQQRNRQGLESLAGGTR